MKKLTCTQIENISLKGVDVIAFNEWLQHLHKEEKLAAERINPALKNIPRRTEEQRNVCRGSRN